MESENKLREMYDRLIDYYSVITIEPKATVDRMISLKMREGLTREEAICKLYSEIFPYRHVGLKTPLKRDLEEALRSLRAESYEAGTSVGLAIVSMLILMFFMLAPPFAAIISLVLFPILFFAIAYSSSRRTFWSFSEDIIVEGAGNYLSKIIKETPNVFQKLTLQNISYEVSENVLNIKLNLEKTIVERSRSFSGGDDGFTVTVGSTTATKLVDIGYFNIKAEFTRRNGDLVVKARYEGNPPPAYGSLAAEAYEKTIVAFRTAVRESYEKLKPRKIVAIDFVKLAELISSSGIVLKAVKCPNCGANIDLPEKGDTVKCPYCGAVVRAIDVYKMIKDLMKEIKL